MKLLNITIKPNKQRFSKRKKTQITYNSELKKEREVQPDVKQMMDLKEYYIFFLNKDKLMTAKLQNFQTSNSRQMLALANYQYMYDS